MYLNLKSLKMMLKNKLKLNLLLKKKVAVAPEAKKEEVKEVKEVEHKTVKEGPLDNAGVADGPSTEEAPFETEVSAQTEEILSENVNPATASSTEDEEW